MIFDYDWWHGDGHARQTAEAKRRAVLNHFRDADPEKVASDPEMQRFHDELESRTIIYLKDNSIYEIRALADVSRCSYLTFECQPADDAYRVGAFVVSLPFDEITRVEVFAVHPSEKPEDSVLIKGFGGSGPRMPKPVEDRPA